MCERCKEFAGLEPENLEELRAEVLRDMANMYATRLKFAKAFAQRPEAWEEAGQRLEPSHVIQQQKIT